jgi:hypothetical protein
MDFREEPVNVRYKRRPPALHLFLPIWLIAGLTAGALALTLGPCVSYAESVQGSPQMRSGSPALTADDDEGDENEVPSDQLEKYVSVYKAMQRNRSLTVEQAAARQGLSLEQFRDLENRVQRDDAALQQARDELQAAAKQASPAPEKGHASHQK